MGSSSESICEPRPATVARGQRRDDVSGRVITLVVPAARRRPTDLSSSSLSTRSATSGRHPCWRWWWWWWRRLVRQQQQRRTDESTASRLLADWSRRREGGATFHADVGRGWRRARSPDFPRSRQKTRAAASA